VKNNGFLQQWLAIEIQSHLLGLSKTWIERQRHMIDSGNIGRLLAAAVFGLLAVAPALADERLSDARAAVAQWVEVESTISREALEWEEKKSLLNDLIAVARTEIKTLKAQIAEADKATGAAETRRAELVAKQDRNAELAGRIEKFLGRIEGRLRQLNPRLPRPLRDKLAPLLQRMPRDPADTELGIAERMQTVMGFISEVQRFDELVTVGEELRTVAEGDVREVRTIHFGLGAAFYVTGDGADAGVGHPSTEGWQWESKPALASAVREAIAMAEGKQHEARFLRLPVTVKEVAK